MDKTFIDHQGEHGRKIPTNTPLSCTFKNRQARAKENKLQGIFCIAPFLVSKLLDSIISNFFCKPGKI